MVAITFVLLCIKCSPVKQRSMQDSICFCKKIPRAITAVSKASSHLVLIKLPNLYVHMRVLQRPHSHCLLLNIGTFPKDQATTLNI